MNSMIVSAKSTSESLTSLSFNESPLVARSRASSNSGSLIFSQQDTQEKEFVAPINIYHEHRGHLEDDKKSRTELNTEILDEDLYSPVQQQKVNNNSTSRELNTGNFASSFLPTKSIYDGLTESTETDTWGYDMFSTNNMFGIKY